MISVRVVPPSAALFASRMSLVALAPLAAGCSVPTVGGPLVFTKDAAPGSTTDAGGGAGSGGDGSMGAPVGDPCAADTDCASGVCADGVWCTRACASDADCGSNSAGVPGVCATASTGQVACYPGCGPGGDCAAYPGTQCEQLAAGGAACSPP